MRRSAAVRRCWAESRDWGGGREVADWACGGDWAAWWEEVVGRIEEEEEDGVREVPGSRRRGEGA